MRELLNVKFQVITPGIPDKIIIKMRTNLGDTKISEQRDLLPTNNNLQKIKHRNHRLSNLNSIQNMNCDLKGFKCPIKK